MTQASQGSAVKVHYTGKLADGTTFDTSMGREPLAFTIGAGEIIPGLESEMVGMAPGETKTITVPADQAYGDYRDDMVQQVSREVLPADVEIEVGSRLEAQGPEGQAFVVTVTDLSDEAVTLDANHPLAGKDLVFEVELLEVA